MTRIILEQTFEKPLSEDELTRQSRRIEACVALRAGTWGRTYLSTDHRRMICEIEAPDAESVREACRSAGVPFDRAWAAKMSSVDEDPDLRGKHHKVLRQTTDERVRS